jgi:hypothetical protein
MEFPLGEGATTEPYTQCVNVRARAACREALGCDFSEAIGEIG